MARAEAALSKVGAATGCNWLFVLSDAGLVNDSVKIIEKHETPKIYTKTTHSFCS